MKRRIAYQQDWEEYAHLDPEWAVLTEKNKRYGKWGKDEFDRTGKSDIENILLELEMRRISFFRGYALDFGCGTGRLTRALAGKFSKVFGVDISQKMIDIANNESQGIDNIVFILNKENNLEIFIDNNFDFVLSLLTLQHLPDRKAIYSFMKEIIRILKPGGIFCFQLPTKPTYRPFKSVLLKSRGWLYYLLTTIGIPRRICYEKIKISPYMHMQYLEGDEVMRILSCHGDIFVSDSPYTTLYFFQKSFQDG